MFNGFIHSVIQPIVNGLQSVTRIFFSLPIINGEEDDLQSSGVASHGYSGWILIPSGVAVHSTLDATAETLQSVAVNSVGYSGWILVPSGINIPSIDEVILGVPETEESLENIGNNIPSIEEVIIGTPVTPEPTPVPVSPGVGGGTYAPIFPQKVPKLAPIKETVVNTAYSVIETGELTTVSDDITVRVVNSNTVTGYYRKTRLIAVPQLPDVEPLLPIPQFVVPKFPDESATGLTAQQRRKKQQEQALLLGLI